jgi:hypothetical protein
MARTTIREKRLTVRLAEPLIDELEAAAAEHPEPVAALVRNLLVRFAADRLAERAKEAA